VIYCSEEISWKKCIDEVRNKVFGETPLKKMGGVFVIIAALLFKIWIIGFISMKAWKLKEYLSDNKFGQILGFLLNLSLITGLSYLRVNAVLNNYKTKIKALLILVVFIFCVKLVLSIMISFYNLTSAYSGDKKKDGEWSNIFKLTLCL
jgi:hypothetical protein